MTKLVWDNVTDRSYEFGVDRGVLSSSAGIVAWNGLISVDETEVDATDLRAAFDGVTYLNLRFGGSYQSVIIALGFPDGFEGILGEVVVRQGFSLTGQMREQFDLSYRTMFGEDEYKIHLIHNALISPTSRGSSSLTDSPTPSELEWRIDAVPPNAAFYKPSAHFIIDSSKVNSTIIIDLEEMLYGAIGVDPIFPSQQQVIDLFGL